MQRQMPEPKKKPKQVVLNDGKQKPKYRKPPATAINQPKKAKAAQMEVPRLVSNKQLKRNQKNWNRRKCNKTMPILRKWNNNCGSHRNSSQCTDLAVHLKQICWAHVPARPYQTANQSREGYFCNAQCTYNQFGQRETKPQLCNRFHRFARADVPANCTKTDI